ncbi:MAG: acyltransferase [Flavobacteriaceae bacterium]|nr:acyltransferase [Flavobacteriaceae bacterium]
MRINYEKRIFGLDLMRAIAISMVIGAHAIWIVPEANGIIPDILSLVGVMGVEVFFVLSGFLIGRIVYKIFVSDDFNFDKIKYFWVRRWFRTLPNYYLILIVNIGIALYLGINLSGYRLWQYFFFIQNLAWEMQGFFPESWSLPVEEFAYIIGPLLLYSVHCFKFNISNSKLFAIVTILIIVFFNLTKIIYNYNVGDSDLIFWNVNLKAVTIYRVDAIYFGVLAAYISMCKPEFWKKAAWIGVVIGAAIVLGLNLLLSIKQLFINTHPYFWNVLYLPMHSIAIACCLPLLSGIKSAPRFIAMPITKISVISYSMYLLHYSIVLQLLKYFMPSKAMGGLDIVIYIMVYMLITVVLSYFVYRLYENPLTNLRDSKFIKGRFKI